MGDGLGKYREKRDFKKTPEPTPSTPGPKRPGSTFVVHRHEARNLHYDLRLEMDGVLKSFAIPRGFSFDPKDKHLAVNTEDHPLEYKTFEGVIPKGQYGAGTMQIWDRGEYEVLNSDDGVAAIEGGKLEVALRGRRLRGEWHLVRTKRSEKDWLIFKGRDRYARSRDEPPFPLDLQTAREARFPQRLRFMEPITAGEPFSDPAWLFEMKFAGLRLFLRKRGGAVELRGGGPRGLLRRLPELERDAVRLRAENAVLDGVLVALDEKERPSTALLTERIQGANEAPLFFYGFDLLYYEEWDLRRFPARDRKGALASLIPKGLPTLQYVDHVEGKGEEFCDVVATAGLPGVVAKRADSPYRGGKSDDWREILVGERPDAATLELSRALEKVQPRGRRLRHKVPFSNLKKVFWPAEGYTKGDLIEYYDEVAETILPYLVDRPMHMNRYPDGIEGKSFYQKDAPDHVPGWITTETIESERKKIRYIVCNDRETLLYLANLGSIDLHPWFSRVGSLETPDWTVLDLDPDGTPFSEVVKVARTAGKLLRGIGLRPCLKTSGSSGLHIYVPLLPRYTYDQSRMFCEGVARLVAREHPDIATVERVVAQRSGRIYVDFLQNRRGQTIVPAYCVRPEPGATVSAPLAWDELTSDLHPSQFTIKTLPDRLRRLGDIFRPALTDRQDLLPAIEKLQESLGG